MKIPQHTINRRTKTLVKMDKELRDREMKVTEDYINGLQKIADEKFKILDAQVKKATGAKGTGLKKPAKKPAKKTRK